MDALRTSIALHPQSSLIVTRKTGDQQAALPCVR
jgi:hypothetical protein